MSPRAVIPRLDRSLFDDDSDDDSTTTGPQWIDTEESKANGGPIRPSKPGDNYLEVLRSYIPIEIITFWGIVSELLHAYDPPIYLQFVALAVALGAIPGYLNRYGIEKPEKIDEEEAKAGITWQHVASGGALLVWAYYLGGPFSAMGWRDPFAAIFLVLAYSFVIPVSPRLGATYMLEINRIVRKFKARM